MLHVSVKQKTEKNTKTEKYFLGSGLKVFKRNKEKHMEGTVIMPFSCQALCASASYDNCTTEFIFM